MSAVGRVREWLAAGGKRRANLAILRADEFCTGGRAARGTRNSYLVHGRGYKSNNRKGRGCQPCGPVTRGTPGPVSTRCRRSLEGKHRAGLGRSWPDAFASSPPFREPLLLTAAFRLVLEAQFEGEPTAWIAATPDTFFPPDAADNGVDLNALVLIRVPEARAAARAADRLLRSGAFGLIVMDLNSNPTFPIPLQARLVRQARAHDTALLCLTCKARESSSLGAMVSLTRTRLPAGVWRFDRFQYDIEILKDRAPRAGLAPQPKSAVDRTACINIRALPLQLLLKRHPEWRRRPVAVVEQEKPQSPILWTNPAAVRAGIRAGNALCLRSFAGPEACVRGRSRSRRSPGRSPAGPRNCWSGSVPGSSPAGDEPGILLGRRRWT